jgi:hypothetical protein
MELVNTLAYYDLATITAVKRDRPVGQIKPGNSYERERRICTVDLLALTSLDQLLLIL